MENPKLKQNYLSLGAKFLLVIIILLTITLGISAYSNYKTQKLHFVHQLNEMGSKIGNFVALVSPDAILAYDFSLLNQYMEEISNSDDIVYGLIIGPDGNPMTSYLNTDNPYVIESYDTDIRTTINRIKKKRNIIAQDYVIEFDNEQLGTLNIGLSKDHLNALSKESFYQYLVQNCIIILLLSFSIYAAYRYNTLRPVRSLIKSIEKVSDGDQKHQAEVLSFDELGRLTIAFNDMTRSLDENMSNLQQTNQKLLSATKAKSAFLANMSHEIRTPLTSIVGFSETLLDKSLTATERATSINSIMRNGDYLQKIINDILDISKIEAEKLDIDLIDVSLFELMDDIENIVSLQTKANGLDFNIYYDFPIPSNIYTDPLRLKQILVNLCSNAVKFTSRGGINIRIKNDMDTSLLSFTVEDTGIGIQSSHLVKIFEAFRQADSTTTREYGGTGLGLAISSELAQMLGGCITVKSKINSGSQFTVSVTTGSLVTQQLIHTGNELRELRHSRSRDAEHILPRCLYGSILIADDNPDNLRFLKLLLKKTQANLTLVDNGLMALNALKDSQFDLILMDLRMPVMNGYDAVKRIRADGNTTPIIAMSANSKKTDIDRCSDFGCDAYIEKPVNRELFFRHISRILPHVDLNNDHTAVSFAASNTNRTSHSTRDPLDVRLKGKVLYAEDTLDNQRLVSMYTRKSGINLIMVENGKMAVEEALKNHYDLILMDMQMPVMGGLEAIAKLKENKCTTPIVALTANALKHDRDAYYLAGCTAFIPKPINRRFLIETIANFLIEDTGVPTGQTAKTQSNPTLISSDNSQSYKDLQRERKVQNEKNIARQCAFIEPLFSEMDDSDPDTEEALKFYIDSLISTQGAISTAFSNNNWEELLSHIHQIKGTGGAYGFPAITNIARIIHAQLVSGDYESIPLLISDFQNLLSRAIVSKDYSNRNNYEQRNVRR